MRRSHDEIAVITSITQMKGLANVTLLGQGHPKIATAMGENNRN